ncbi:MAG: type I-E CRISPR-associated protein Cas5/CasD [Rhodomicrobium sp.]
MQRHLVLRLEAPLVSFGGEAIDNLGVIRPFPAKSMITGILANAAGIERYERKALQSLQDNLVMGSRIHQGNQLLRDFQTAELSKGDQGWTTHEQVEGRGGGTASYLGPHLRYRDYWTDAEVSVVFRVLPASPFTIEQFEEALQHPARPLFLGRKTCLPSSLVYDGDVRAHSVFGALIALFDDSLRKKNFYLQWPAFEASEYDDALFSQFPDARLEPICDERNWITGVHAGERLVHVLDFNQSMWEQL